MCTALKVHASASTHVLQFLARGRDWGRHISVQTRFYTYGLRVRSLRCRVSCKLGTQNSAELPSGDQEPRAP